MTQDPATPEPSTTPAPAARGAFNAVEADTLTITRGALGGARAREVNVRMGAIGGVIAGTATSSMGSVGGLVARDARVSKSFVSGMAAQHASVETAIVRGMIAQNVTTGPRTFIGIAVAQNITGEAKVLLDWRGGLALGLAAGGVMSLLRLVRAGRRKG